MVSAVDQLLVDRDSGLLLDRRQVSGHSTRAVLPLSPTLLQFSRAHSGAGVYGVERIYSTVRVPGTDWVLLAGVSHAAAFAHASRDLYRNLLVGGALLFADFLLGAVVYRRIVRPTKRLRDALYDLAGSNLDRTDFAEAVLLGDHSGVPEHGPRELAELGAAFNTMAGERVR